MTSDMRFRNILKISVALAGCLSLASCEKPAVGNTETEDTEAVRLEAPVISVESKAGDSFTVVWEPVDNADYYSISVNGSEKPTSQTRSEIAAVEGESYTVKVKATSTSDKYADSEWSEELTYTFESWFTFKYEETAPGSYEVYIKGTDVVECYFMLLAEAAGWADEDILWLLTESKDGYKTKLSDDIVEQINSEDGYTFTHTADISGYSGVQIIVLGVNSNGEFKLIRESL